MQNNSYTISESTIKLFNSLQEEYVICKLRSKIYPIKKLKEYWEKLANQKKIKICDISIRNNIKSIFTDQFLQMDIDKKIYDKNGIPNFYYPKEDIKEQQKKWDIINYFSIASQVIYKNQIYTIITFNQDTNIEKSKIIIENNVEKIEVDLNNIKRIL